MFDNIAALKFSKNQANNEVTALGMISAEKEEMEYRTTVGAEGRVEASIPGSPRGYSLVSVQRFPLV